MLEDKIVQRATVEVLNATTKPTFLVFRTLNMDGVRAPAKLLMSHHPSGTLWRSRPWS